MIVAFVFTVIAFAAPSSPSVDLRSHAGEALGRFEELEITPVETNIVYFRHRGGKGPELAKKLRRHGVLLSRSAPTGCGLARTWG